MPSKMKPENKFFTHAYKEWTGETWKWRVNGKENHPMDSGDPKIMAFYQGFWFAKRGQGFLLGELQHLKWLERNISEVRKRIDKWRNV